VNHLRCLHEFVEAQAAYYAQGQKHMQDLQKELSRTVFLLSCLLKTGFPMPLLRIPLHQRFPLPLLSPVLLSPGVSNSAASSSSLDTLKIEEVKAPATGTRKAKVLYDYDAADTSELSLLADELITVYTVPGMDPDWLIGERGNQKGKVPVTYLELLS
ncbi:hypothetical protein QTP86_033569, partial [Hemibagrus guttatus]